MNITNSLLYLLMLYAVLDNGNKLSPSKGLAIALAILLADSYLMRNIKQDQSLLEKLNGY